MLAQTQPDFCTDFASVIHDNLILSGSLQTADDHIRRRTVDLIQQAVYPCLVQTLHDRAARHLKSGICLLEVLVQAFHLVLCFTERQRQKIVELAPRMRSRTFLLTDFADLCAYCAQNNLIEGDMLEDRLDLVLANASLVRPMLPPAHDIDDPYRKEFPAFETAHQQIGEAFATIAAALEPAKGAHAI